MEYLNPLVDYVFKKIFGTSENKDILIRFLNDFFNDPSQVIVDLQILNPLNEREYPNDKDTALDIKVQTNCLFSSSSTTISCRAITSPVMGVMSG